MNCNFSTFLMSFVLFVLFSFSTPLLSVELYEEKKVSQILIEFESPEVGIPFDPKPVLSKLRTKVGDKFSQYTFDNDLKALHSLKITPELRQSILKGMPAFARGGGVDHAVLDLLGDQHRLLFGRRVIERWPVVPGGRVEFRTALHAGDLGGGRVLVAAPFDLLRDLADTAGVVIAHRA